MSLAPYLRQYMSHLIYGAGVIMEFFIIYIHVHAVYHEQISHGYNQ